MNDALVQDDGIDLIVGELDRCWEVTQDQDKAPKIEKALCGTQRDVKTGTTFMSYVVRRKLSFQQLENALDTPLPAVIEGCATLRDAKLAESSYDKVVMWTGGSYEYEDVMRALVRLDRSAMRPGTSGQNGKTVPTFHRPRSGCSDNRCGLRGLDTTRYRLTTLERGSRCVARGRRFVRGRIDDNRTRRGDRHPGCVLHYRQWPRGERGRI